MWRLATAAAAALALALVRAEEASCEAGGSCDAAPAMPYRYLGNTGLQVSLLSYGAWVTFGTQLNDDEALEIMQTAFDAGINFFDNAEGYAAFEAERVMGRALKRAGWERSDYVLSTKIFWGQGPENKRVNRVGLGRKRIREGLAGSLERLQVDYVDLVFAHRPDLHTPIEETVRAFNWALDQGWALYWGTSEWTAEQIAEAHAIAARLGMVGPAMEQPEYSIMARERFEVEYAPLYAKYGMGTTTWSPLASGMLTGKYNNGIPEGSRFSLPSMKRLMRKYTINGDWDATIETLKGLGEIAADLGVSQAQLAIAWCTKNPNVSTVILGGTKVSQLKENIAALRVVPLLTDEVMARIDAVLNNAPAPAFDWVAWDPSKK